MMRVLQSRRNAALIMLGGICDGCKTEGPLDVVFMEWYQKLIDVGVYTWLTLILPLKFLMNWRIGSENNVSWRANILVVH